MALHGRQASCWMCALSRRRWAIEHILLLRLWLLHNIICSIYRHTAPCEMQCSNTPPRFRPNGHCFCKHAVASKSFPNHHYITLLFDSWRCTVTNITLSPPTVAVRLKARKEWYIFCVFSCSTANLCYKCQSCPPDRHGHAHRLECHCEPADCQMGLGSTTNSNFSASSTEQRTSTTVTLQPQIR